MQLDALVWVRVDEAEDATATWLARVSIVRSPPAAAKMSMLNLDWMWSTTGKALIAASHDAAEKAPEDEFDSGSTAERPNLVGLLLRLAILTVDSSFSGVGQIPSCSYRSKKLELVGGDRRLILVDRDRGRSLAEPLRGISELKGWLFGRGRGGRGASGAGDDGAASVGRGKEVKMVSDGVEERVDGGDTLVGGK